MNDKLIKSLTLISSLINNNEVTLTGDSKILATDNYAGGIAGNAAKNVRIYGNTVTIDSVNQISVSSTPDPYTASTVCGGGSAKFESTTSAGEGNTVIIGGSSDTVTNKGPITL